VVRTVTQRHKFSIPTDTEQDNKGIGGGEEKGERKGTHNNSRNEGKWTKVVLAGKVTESTEK
jgi:hypothetical protein